MSFRQIIVTFVLFALMGMSVMKKKLTIAMVAAQPFPTLQGTQVSIRQMSEALTRLGHKVHVVCYHIGDPQPVKGFAVERIPNLINYSKFRAGPSIQKPMLDFLLAVKLYQVVRREKVDIIHSHNYEAPLAGYLVRFFTGIPVVYHGHNLMSDELHQYFGSPAKQFFFRNLGKFLDFSVPRMADYTIAISAEIADFLSERGVRRDRLAVIPLGIFPEEVPLRDAAKMREKYNIGKEKIILYNGNCDRYQNIPNLFEAMPAIVEKVPDAKLVFLTNELEEQYVNLATEKGVDDRTLFVETNDFNQVVDFFNIADVAVSPRTSCPGIPIKLLNYMAARKPIVTFRGSAKNLVNGKHCLVAENGDIRGFADAVVRLLLDRPLAQRLGDNAFEFLKEEYDWIKIAERIETVYYDLVNR